MKENKVKKQTGVRLDPAQIKAMKYAALDLNRSLASVMEEAIDDFLKKHAKRKR